jgi:hypothetical protein
VAIDRGPAGDAHADRRPRRLARIHAVCAQISEHALALALHDVDAQIERRGILQRAAQSKRFLGTECRDEALVNPVRQLRAHRRGQALERERFHILEPRRFARVQHRLDLARAGALEFDEPREEEPAWARLLRERIERALVPQHAENPFRHERTVVLPERALVAKVMAQHGVGRVLEFEHLA